ncbi:MAG: AbrB/MazE/SpoVT family DNA-binding domain-containing protein [Lachnospiraceae bacterium]|nr:AbrB/MazE/SpoVT family DNA-binding domain-containing protein [Lachnospiraceae bacterium]
MNIMFRYKRKIAYANKKTNSSRVNIPSEILQILKAEIGDHLYFNVTDDKEIIITKAED